MQNSRTFALRAQGVPSGLQFYKLYPLKDRLRLYPMEDIESFHIPDLDNTSVGRVVTEVICFLSR